jgi:hypothetical protein
MPITQRTTDDHELIAEARIILGRAEREGIGICRLPIWMLEALIEKAQRPHD